MPIMKSCPSKSKVLQLVITAIAIAVSFMIGYNAGEREGIATGKKVYGSYYNNVERLLDYICAQDSDHFYDNIMAGDHYKSYSASRDSLVLTVYDYVYD